MLLVLAPVLCPFLTAIVMLMFWGKPQIQRVLGVAGSVAGWLTAWQLLQTVQSDGVLTLAAGNWAPPFGIMFVADHLAAIMVLVTATMSLIVLVYALVDMDIQRELYGFYPLYQFLITGVTGSFLTGDIFNLYVWFEIMLISSFVLLALGGGRAQLEGTIKYVTLNLISSAIFLVAIGLLYGITGALNMAHLSRLVAEAAVSNRPVVVAIASLFLLAFGLKAAVFPLFGWLPASYHTPPTTITTIFGALLTKVGVYAILRTFTLIFYPIMADVQMIMVITAAFTMVTGVFGAVSQFDLRRLLSFHIVSQIGYLIMGIAIYTPLAIAGTIFFMVHVIFAKSALFLVGGVINRLQGSYNLKQLGGLYKANLGLSALFFVPALALAGIPPLSGFWAKFAIVRGALEAGQYGLVAVGLFVSMLTLYSMIKIWTYAFWSQRPAEFNRPLPQLPAGELFPRLAPPVVLALLTVWFGVYGGPLFSLSLQAAEQLLNRQAYIQAVLGG